jgi:hypothetical protein
MDGNGKLFVVNFKIVEYGLLDLSIFGPGTFYLRINGLFFGSRRLNMASILFNVSRSGSVGLLVKVCRL